MCFIWKTLTHVLIPPAINIPKQNLRNGTLLWLSLTHSQTHLSDNHSSSNAAENCRKLHSKTNWTVTNACKALEIPIPVTWLQHIKCQGPAATWQSLACMPSLTQLGAMHIALVFSSSQQWKLPPERAENFINIMYILWGNPPCIDASSRYVISQRVPWSKSSLCLL